MAVVLHIPFPLLFLYWYGLTCALAMFNYSLWVRFQDDLVSDDLQNTYLAFSIIGLIAYVFLGGPMFFVGYKYSQTQKNRDKRVRIGLVVMYFASTLPLFLMDLYFVWQHGVLHVLQGICFVLQVVAWSTGSFAVWFIYMWQVAKLWHTKRGSGRQLQFQQPVGGMRDGMSPNMRPPLQWSAAKPLPGQPDVI